MKIKQKLNILFVALTIFSTLIIGGIAFFMAKEALKEQTLNGLQSTLNSKIATIQSTVNLRKEQVNIIAGTYLMKQLNSEGNNDTSLINKIQQHIDFILIQLQRTDNNPENIPVAEQIAVWDVQGNIIAHTKRDLIGIKTNRSFIEKIKKHDSFFSGYHYDSLIGKYSLAFYSAVHKPISNEIIGVVEMKLNTNYLKEICFDFEGLGKTGEILLTQIEKDSIQFIVPVRNALNPPRITYASEKGLATQLSLKGNAGRGLTTDYRGIKVYSVWKPLKEFNWGIALEIDEEEALLPITKMRNNILYALFIVILITLILSHYFSLTFSIPIKKITSVFSHISKGEIKESVTIYSKDEFGQLSATANETIAYLKNIISHANKLGNGDYNSNILSKGNKDELGNALQKMTENLRLFDEENKNTIWLQSAIANVNNLIRGDLSVIDVAEKTLGIIAHSVNAQAGLVYEFSKDENQLKYLSGYALPSNYNKNNIALGEGIAGQAAKEKKQIALNNVPHTYLKINSLLGETDTVCITAIPLVFNDELKGLIELASLSPLSKTKMQFLNNVSEILAIAITTSNNHKKIQELLSESQSQTEELSAQQEELQQQTNRLVASEEELKMQQEELIQNNKQLEEKSILLEEKAIELERISNYKSEFLANMSHELRTPLNSIMLLSKLLGDNHEENLSQEQIEFARIIHNSGNNLLKLISDILDLTKIESGKSEILLEPTSIRNICRNLDDIFIPLAKEKGILYSCKPIGDIPEQIITDGFRLEQILKNLVSNAIKFTEKGSVTIEVSKIYNEDNTNSDIAPNATMQFSIIDTGVGIPADKQDLVFNVFQQADGSTHRKFGGTGLGLSISKKLANLLGGNIMLESEPGKGSTFTLLIPCNSSDFVAKKELNKSSFIKYDEQKNNLTTKNKILVVEDNNNHLLALIKFLENKNFECAGVATAKEALEFLSKNSTQCIILDMGLPDSNGNELLEKIKKNNFSSIPVIIYTGNNISQKAEQKLKKYADAIVIKSANSYQRLLDELSLIFNLTKKVNEDVNLPDIDISLKNKSVLIVDDDIRNIYALTKILENQNMLVLSALNGKEALILLNENPSIKLVLMDMMMPEIDGYEAISIIRKNNKWKKLPIIALTAKAMLGDREKCIAAGASDYLTKPLDAEQLISLIKIWLFK